MNVMLSKNPRRFESENIETYPQPIFPSSYQLVDLFKNQRQSKKLTSPLGAFLLKKALHDSQEMASKL